MNQKLLHMITYFLTIFILFPTFAVAQNKTQYATFHGFDHHQDFHHWQMGKIMTVDNQCAPSNAPWYARSICGICDGTFDPILVTPGTHVLSVSSPYSYGFMRGPYTGSAQFKVNFAAGQHYFLNGSIVEERTIKLWIEDSKGRKISNIVTVFGNYHSEAASLPAVFTRLK